MLNGKTVLITGGAGGIGRALAVACSKNGAAVIVLDVDVPGADAVAKQIRDAGGAAVSFGVDIASADQVETAFRQVAAWSGKLDVLVNCAGIYIYKNAVTLEEAEWDRCVDIDLKGTWLCCKQSIPLMTAAGGGSIVNIASTHALRAQGNAFPYNVAKAGMLSLTQSLAVDFGVRGIRVNAVCPGFVFSSSAVEYIQGSCALTIDQMMALQPLPVRIDPEDVADAVVFLASDMARCITGATLLIDGGRTSFLNIRHGEE
jgi:NAD(P)-dependent dehydrogenase (short-subunit alcohol dehydrogenase family)